MINENMEQYLDIGGKLAQKWNFLCESIDDDYTKKSTAILLENTVRKINEQTNGLITEGFESTDVTGINRILLPIIRRVYPHLMANEFVTVQPMLTPTAQIFYLRYRYGSDSASLDSSQFNSNETKFRKGQSEANDEFLRVPAYGSFGLNPYYSSQQVVNHPVQDTANAELETADVELIDDASTSFAKTLKMKWTPILSSTVKAKVVEVVTEQIYPYGTVAEGGTPQTRYKIGDTVAQINFANEAGGTNETLTGTLTPDSTSGILNVANTQFDEVNNELLVTLESTWVQGVASGITYMVVADWEYNQEGTSQIPEMKINIETDFITAKERKLKTEFTQEAMQDLKALHNIDAEAELTAVISSMLIAEIDREILADLLNGSAIRDDYDYLNDGVNQSSRNWLDRNQALSAKLIDLGARIHQEGKLGSANWAVTNPRIGAKLESTRGFESANLGKHEEFNMGIRFAGTISGKQMKIYVDPYFPDNKILMGYKGNSFLSTSYVYAPYQPLYTTPLIYDPATLKPIRGFMTRYGTKMVIGGDHLLAVLNLTNIQD